ncbi:RHS repeat-associated core domain-containing protein, partial [Tahibacter caeni]|uniref:RHS repeat-associated core domain-containing protein n=1 Tax=Tahibacter caeni TaxID=1453545 RepID=UPI0021492F0F
METCCSAWTGSYTIHVQFGTPPDAPNPLTATLNPTTNGLFTVSWANVGSNLTYKLVETTGGGWVTLVNDACTTTCTTSWTPGTARPIGNYSFIAQACNATGCSTSYPLTVAVQEDTSFPPPTGSIGASPNPSTTGNYTVQWTAVSGATYYKLYEKDNGVEQGVIQNGSSLSWSPSSPRATGDYEYWVKACKTLVNGTDVCSVDSAVYTERVRLPGVPPTPGWIGFSPTNNGNNQVICNNVNPRTFTLYWEASSGDLDHYEIFESNFATGDMPPTIISRPDPIEHPEIPPPSNATLTRYKDGNPYLVYYYQVRACNAAGGDSGCSAYRGIAEMCVGSPSTFGPNRVVSTTYYHTDALGSPVAETNAAGTVIKRSRYEPYGLPATSTFADAPGYTGHVEDSFTQLSYMQQRYYDPLIGRFLSVDPIASSLTNGANFNRYRYANNSPYKYTDPDGRWVCSDGGSGNCGKFEVALNRITDAAKNDRLTQSEQAQMKKIGDFFGKKGDDSVSVSFAAPSNGADGNAGLKKGVCQSKCVTATTVTYGQVPVPRRRGSGIPAAPVSSDVPIA